MAYQHGVRVQENPTSLPTPATSQAGVPVIFGTAPVNLASDPAHATNKLFLCHTFAEAQSAVGYSEDYENYTLCQAMDAFFKAFGVGPIVICNVLDPANNSHTEAITGTSATVTDGQAVLPELGIILSTLTFKNGSTDLVLDTDYTLAFNEEGKVVVTVLAAGISTLTVAGRKLKPSGVAAADIIGSYNSSTGVETGLELVRQVYPTFGEVPSLLLAPGWSHLASVGVALQGKCTDINGLFSCECILDIETSTTKKYTDVEAKKNSCGYLSEHSIVLWPMVKYAEKKMYMSAIYAAMVVYTDKNNEDVPNLSPSNKALRIGATVLADGTEVLLDQTQANVLNGAGIVTALNLNGFKAWGNNTAVYPDNSDPKDRWIGCRRFFSWWGNNFILTYMSKVDNPANYRLIESIVDSENVRANSLVSSGKCAGLRMVYDPADNPVGNVIDGKIKFREYLAPYTPAEDILCVLEFDPSMIEAALGGE